MHLLSDIVRIPIFPVFAMFLVFLALFLLGRERMYFLCTLSFRDLNVFGFSTDAFAVVELPRGCQDLRIALGIGTEEEDRTSADIARTLRWQGLLIVMYTAMFVCAAILVVHFHLAWMPWLWILAAIFLPAVLNVLEIRAIHQALGPWDPQPDAAEPCAPARLHGDKLAATIRRLCLARLYAHAILGMAIGIFLFWNGQGAAEGLMGSIVGCSIFGFGFYDAVVIIRRDHAESPAVACT
jgi:hypothetical protein